MSTKKNKKRWTKFRHKIARTIIAIVITPYIKIRYRIKIDKSLVDRKKQYLILLNHQTPFDQFFVGMAIPGAIYYMATEDIFSKGIISKIIKFLVAPIPIKKQTADVRAVLNCMKVANEGGKIAIAPEGNRTYSGRTGYMNPAIVPLVRKLGLPLALFRIEGGYGKEPRWSDVIRGGRMKAGVTRVLEPQEYVQMTDDELLFAIKSELYVDESEVHGVYKSKKSAEYLERAIYTCPYHGLTELYSRGTVVECKRCGRKVVYTDTKSFVGLGFDFPFKNVGEWYDYQNNFIASLDTREMREEPIYLDTGRFMRVIVYKRKELIGRKVSIALFGDRVEIFWGECEYVFPFDKTSAFTVLGRNKLNIYFGDEIYQIKGDKHFCALKYVNLFHRYRNIQKGEKDGQFFGI